MLFVLMRTTAFTYVEDRGAPDCRRNGHYNRGALRNEAITVVRVSACHFSRSRQVYCSSASSVLDRFSRCRPASR